MVELYALTSERVDDVLHHDGSPSPMLSVAESVVTEGLEKGFDDCAGFFVNETTHARYTSATAEAADCWISDALNHVFFLVAHVSLTLAALGAFAASACMLWHSFLWFFFATIFFREYQNIM